MADPVDATISRLRTVLVALIAGLLAFGAVALTLGPLGQAPDPAMRSALLLVLASLCLGGTVAYRAIHQQTLKRLLARSGELRGSPDPSALVLQEYQQLFFVRAGLAEGPGFLALIIHLLTGSPAALVVAAGALAVLVSQLPSRERVRELALKALATA